MTHEELIELVARLKAGSSATGQIRPKLALPDLVRS